MLSNVTKRGITTNKNVWTFIMPFLTNKGFLENNDITLIEENKVITSERELSKTFNEHYILTLLKKVVEQNHKISPSVTKTRISIKKLEKLSNPTTAILVYCK